MEQLKPKEFISKKGLFLLGALGLAAIVAMSLPKQVTIISIGNLYTNKENK